MAISQSRPFGQRYAFVVVAVIFLALLVAAALRSSMSVMMVPLEDAFGWRRDSISFATACIIPLVWLLVPERPSSIGLTRYGAEGPEPQAAGVPGNFLALTLGT